MTFPEGEDVPPLHVCLMPAWSRSDADLGNPPIPFLEFTHNRIPSEASQVYVQGICVVASTHTREIRSDQVTIQRNPLNNVPKSGPIPGPIRQIRPTPFPPQRLPVRNDLSVDIERREGMEASDQSEAGACVWGCSLGIVPAPSQALPFSMTSSSLDPEYP